MTLAPVDHPSPRFGLPRLVAFSMPGVCVGALAVALGVFLPRYYAGHFGLGLFYVGLAFGFVRLFDTLLDPVIGVLMDRTRTALGRYRVWLAAGAPALMIPVYMLFIPPFAVNYLYLVGWLFVYYIGTSFVTLSHLSWASIIAPTYHERSRMFGAIQVLGILGATAVLILPVVMARRDGSSGAGDVGAMGWFVILATAIGIALALMFTRERIVPDSEDERFGLRDYWEMISRPDMARIIVADFCLALGPGWMAALYLFYFHDARGFTIASASKLLLVYVVAGVAGAATLSWLARRLGKHRTQMCASTGYSLGLIALSFLPRADFAPAAVFMFVMGFLASAFTLLDRAMVADVGDAVRLEQGKHRVGLLYAMITTTQKVAGALSITLSFTVLGLIGYQAKEGAINTATAISGMELVFLIGPVVFVMLGGACFIGYELDSKRHADIRAQLEERDALLVARASSP
ncbi:MAG: MFS transporter [Caulobacteraceae bacterium]